MDMSHLLNMDTTGLEALTQVKETLHKQGGHLVFCDLPPQPKSLLERSGFVDTLGRDHVFESIAEARNFNTSSVTVP